MLIKFSRSTFYRNFSNSVIRKNMEKKPETSASVTSSSASHQEFSVAKTPTNFEKKILIYSGRYKTMDEIPKLITRETIERSKSKIRIKIANVMLLTTLIACGVIIYNGKLARKEKIKKWEEKQMAIQTEKENMTAQQH